MPNRRRRCPRAENACACIREVVFFIVYISIATIGWAAWVYRVTTEKENRHRRCLPFGPASQLWPSRFSFLIVLQLFDFAARVVPWIYVSPTGMAWQSKAVAGKSHKAPQTCTCVKSRTEIIFHSFINQPWLKNHITACITRHLHCVRIVLPGLTCLWIQNSRKYQRDVYSWSVTLPFLTDWHRCQYGDQEKNKKSRLAFPKSIICIETALKIKDGKLQAHPPPQMSRFEHIWCMMRWGFSFEWRNFHDVDRSS